MSNRVVCISTTDGAAGEEVASLVADRLRFRVVDEAIVARASYLQRFYGVSAERPSHYDLVVNTDRLTPERAAALVVEAATATT